MGAAKVCSTYPLLEETGAIEHILPKKEQAILAKLCATGGFPCSLLTALRLARHATGTNYGVLGQFDMVDCMRTCRPDRVQVIIINGVPLFFSQREDTWFPTLRLLHQYPDMMPKLRADTGAIKFVVSGANIMCPGLTSPGATLHDEVT